MSLEKKLKEICTSEIEFVSLSGDSVNIYLPYETSIVNIEIEGDSEAEKINSFKVGVNHQLRRMIDHLNDVKFDDVD